MGSDPRSPLAVPALGGRAGAPQGELGELDRPQPQAGVQSEACLHQERGAR